jgi:tetratricopeptide (TPR) repeat protein
MAMRPKKPMKTQSEIQKNGIFTGTAQAGPARPKRAHALAEELLARGCVYIQKQVWDEAAREFRKAIKMEPDYAEAYNNLGLCMLYANKAEEALEALQQALDLFPGWAIAEANLGLAFQRCGQMDDAIACYEKSVLKNRKQPSVFLALGDAYAAVGKIDKALDSYDNAIGLAPKYDMAYYRIGMLQARRNNIDEAEVALLKAVELEPDNVEAVAVLGAISARKGNLNMARDYFSQVMELEKVPAPAQRGMNRLQIFRKGLRNAFNEWKAGMPETQPLAVCYYNLGLAHLTANNAGEAKEAFRNASDADPNWALPPIWFGFFAALDGDAMAARKYWDNALKLEPDNAMLREQLGYLAIAMGLQKEADAHFKEALRLGRDIPQEDMQPDAGSRVQKAVQ